MTKDDIFGVCLIAVMLVTLGLAFYGGVTLLSEVLR
jgi:hypothetical protein